MMGWIGAQQAQDPVVALGCHFRSTLILVPLIPYYGNLASGFEETAGGAVIYGDGL
jgi:hypothetical protein